MRMRVLLMAAACAVALVVVPVSRMRADESNKLTYFTFSGPVELPGVTLPGGTYMFKLLDGNSSRNVVQVFNKQGTKIYATILTIQDYRPEASDKTVIKFSETAAGAPPAVKEWFYPGDNFGQEFVYPKNRAVELAKASNQSVPSMPQNVAQNITQPAKTANDASVVAMKNSDLKSQEPSGQEVEVAEAFLIIQPATPPAGNTNHNVNSDADPATLPATASELPALGLLGGCLTLIGLGLLRMSKRTA